MKRSNTMKPAIFLLAVLAPVVAVAQSTSTPSIQPGRTQQRLQIDNTRPNVGGAPIITVPDEKGKEKDLNGGVAFELKTIAFENLTAFTEADLRPLYQEWVGKKVTLAALNQIAGKITAHYRNAGYILSRAVVPPQHIKGGTVKVRIIEGRINKVRFEGVPQGSSLLASYADKIRNAKPLDAATLERYLLLMEDLPGVKVSAVIRPSQGVPGTSDLVVTVKETPVDGSVTIDNRGTRYMGPVQANAVAGINNMFGLYDRTQLHGVITSNTNELKYGEILHEEQLNAEGTKLGLSASRTATRPDHTLKAFEIEGDDTLYSASLTHPFIRTRQSNLYGNAQFDIRNTTTDTLGTRLYEDKLRVLRAGAAYDFVDSMTAVNKLEGKLSKGFGWDDDSPARSRASGRTDFWKFNATATRLQPITGPFSAALKGTAQWSADSLLSAEQFGVGGKDFGSAFDPSEIVGDSGIAGRLELQYTGTLDPKYMPSYQLYTFYDAGKVWLRNALAGQNSSDALSSTGVGVRFDLMDPLTGELEFALPVSHRVAANGGDGAAPRVFFSLSAHYN